MDMMSPRLYYKCEYSAHLLHSMQQRDDVGNRGSNGLTWCHRIIAHRVELSRGASCERLTVRDGGSIEPVSKFLVKLGYVLDNRNVLRSGALAVQEDVAIEE